jgi:hypothetical protein
MRRNFVRLGLLASLGAALLGAPARAQPLPPVAEVSFYEVLSPYGDWLVIEGYGSVWRPHAWVVGADFYPYVTAGHWEYTVYGWSWVSSWPWGWVPFHHGRWLLTEEWGWVWIPGDIWAPAWVEWRIGGGFIGWVPLGPPGVLLHWPWYAPRWCWVHAHNFHRHDLHHHRIVHPRAEDDARHSTRPVTEPAAAAPRGPSPEDVLAEGGAVIAKPVDVPRRLPPAAVAAERRISQPAASSTERPLAPPIPARREATPPGSWRLPGEVPQRPWQPPPAQLPQRPFTVPGTGRLDTPTPAPLPPLLEGPEAAKKKQQKGVPTAPLPTAPGPRRKVPLPPPGR